MNCIINSAHGCYIPKFFAERFLSPNALYGVPKDAYESLVNGPDDDWYCDAWDDVLQYFIGPNGETLYQDGDLFLLEWNEIITEEGDVIVETMLMNPVTGSVDTEANWQEAYEESTPEEWGGEDFDDAGLIEVMPNVAGRNGYNPAYGEWRPVE